jgi:NADPH2:quinone reductase
LVTQPSENRQLHSKITNDGKLQLSIVTIPLPEPAANEVVIRVEASPINPSDLGLLFGPADMSTAVAGGTADNPTVTADVPPKLMGAMAARLDQSLAVGNEGAGVVIAAGADAQELMGRTVAVLGGEMYSEYRVANAKQCLLLPEGTTSAQGASCFVNPLTALGMVETMKLEGHSALVHTAAASNLGQMLQKICLADGVELVNVVRKPEQEALLRGIGAKHVCNSTNENFLEEVTAALAATNATLGFDATGGGKLAGQLLGAMEAAAGLNAKEYSRYGSTTYKQVYIYGGLDRSQTVLNRNFGMAWGLGGWLLPPFLAKIGPEAAQKLRERVANEITTTFASHYTQEVSLTQALDPAVLAGYAKQATGEKYLVVPHSG